MVNMHIRPRQSGKTTMLIEAAMMKASTTNEHVLILVNSDKIARYLEEKMVHTYPDAKSYPSISSVPREPHGHNDGHIFVDEYLLMTNKQKESIWKMYNHKFGIEIYTSFDKFYDLSEPIGSETRERLMEADPHNFIWFHYTNILVGGIYNGDRDEAKHFLSNREYELEIENNGIKWKKDL